MRAATAAKVHCGAMWYGICCAVLCCAALRCAALRCAALRCAVRCRASLS